MNSDDDLDYIGELSVSEWARRLQVTESIVWQASSNRNVLFLRTAIVRRLLGNPQQPSKLKATKQALIRDRQPLRSVPQLRVSATSDYAYLDEGNHRVLAFATLKHRWVPVQIMLTWDEEPTTEWRARRYALGLNRLPVNFEALPLPRIGAGSYTPNTATAALMRRVYRVEVLDMETYSPLMLTAAPSAQPCSVCERPAEQLCGACGVEAYCSSACQQSAWSGHLVFCEFRAEQAALRTARSVPALE